MSNKLRHIPVGFYRLIKARLFNIKFPHAIQFNITFKCNQRCAYCGIYNDKRDEMTTEQIYNMIDEFVEIGTSRLSITGGEPLLRNDLPSVVHHARNQGLFVSLATNASLVSRDIDRLSEANSINVTLDGPEPIHDRQRGEGNFKKVLTAIELIRNKGIPIYVNSVITKYNCTHIRDILELARSLDIKVLLQPVFFSAQSHANNVKGYNDTKYDGRLLINTLKELIKIKEEGNSHVMLSKRYYHNVINAIKDETKIRCSNAGSLFCTISPDGRVAPCNLLVRDLRWLNGNEIGFRRAFMDMPSINCDGCLSSFLDIDDLYSLKPDVAWNYYKHYLKILTKPNKAKHGRLNS